MKHSLKLKSLANVFGQVIQFSVALYLTPFVINHLGESYFSLWVFFNTLISFEGFLLFGTMQSLNRYIPFFIGKDDKDSYFSVIRSHFIFYLLLGFIVYFLMLFFSDHLVSFFNLPEKVHKLFTSAFPIVLLSLSISFLNKILVSMNKGNERFFYYNFSFIIVTLVRFLVVFLGIEKYGFMALPYSLLTANCLLFFLLFLRAKSDILESFKKFSLQKDSATFRMSIIFASGSMLMYISDIFRHQIDTFLILKFVNLESLAYYKIGVTLLWSMNTVNIGLFEILLTRLSFNKGRNEFSESKELMNKSFFFSSLLASYFILGLSLVARDFLPIWIGDYNENSLKLIYLLAIPQMLMMTQYPSINIFYSLGKHKVLGVLTFGESLVNLSISLILVHKVGILGVVIGTGVGFLLSNGVVIPIMLKKYAQIGFRKQLEAIGPNLLIGLTSYFILTQLFKLVSMPDGFMNFLVKSLLVTAIFGILFNLFYSLFPGRYAGPFLIRNFLRRDK